MESGKKQGGAPGTDLNHETHERILKWSLAATGALLLAVFLAPVIAGGGLIPQLPFYGLFARIPGTLQPASAGIIRCLIFTSAGLLLTYFYLSREAFLFKTRLTIPVLLFFALATASVFWSISRYATFIALLELLGYVLLLFLLIHLMVTRERINGLIVALGAAAAIVCALGLQEYLLQAVSDWKGLIASRQARSGFSGFLQYMLTNPTDWRIFGPFLNANIFANFMIVLIPITLARYLLVEERAGSVGFGFLLILEVSALMLSASKGAIGALVIAMGLFGLLVMVARIPLGPRPLARMISIGLILLALATLFVHPLLNRLTAATTTEAHSGAFRAYLWKSTWEIIKAHPFGTGLGTFELAYPKYALVGHTQTAHNSYLQIASEIGIPGLLAFLWILLALAGTVVSALGANRRGMQRHAAVPLLMVGFTAAVTASAIHSLVDYAWYLPATALAFWMALGMTQVTSGISDVKIARFGLISWAISLVILLGLTAVSIRISTAAMDAEFSLDLERHSYYREALEYRKAAVQYDPWNPENRHRLARLLPAEGGLDEAVEESRKAVSAEPANSRYQMTLAIILEMKGDIAGARRAMQNASRSDPNSDEIWRRIAEFETRHGRSAAAEKAWRRVVDIEESPVGRWPAVPELVNPTPARAHAALGRIAARRNRWKEAIRNYEKAEKILAAYSASQKDYRFQAMREIGQTSAEETKELSALRKNILQELSEAYRKTGDTAKAEQALRRIGELKEEQ